MSDYSILGKRARVLLYDRAGRVLGVLEGRIADVTRRVPVGRDPDGNEIKKDLVYLVDIEPGRDEEGNSVPFKNSAGTESEGWFAIQDITILDDSIALFRN
jgi:hypothetical protein